MAALATQSIVRTGVAPAYTAAAGGGDTMECGPSMFLHIKNGGGSPITVTLAVVAGDPGTGLVIADLAVSVTNAQERMIGPVLPQFFANPTTGVCNITYSGVTTVTVGAFHLAQS